MGCASYAGGRNTRAPISVVEQVQLGGPRVQSVTGRQESPLGGDTPSNAVTSSAERTSAKIESIRQLHREGTDGCSMLRPSPLKQGPAKQPGSLLEQILGRKGVP